jgi:hypothetical protein
VSQRVINHCAGLSLGQVVGFGLVLAAAIELFTVWTRFGLGLEATRDTPALARWTFGLRIHHGYVGVVLAAAAWLFGPGVRNFLCMLAIGLIASDLMHHFLVLWPLTGSPQFDLVYPPPPEPPGAGK